MLSYLLFCQPLLGKTTSKRRNIFWKGWRNHHLVHLFIFCGVAVSRLECHRVDLCSEAFHGWRVRRRSGGLTNLGLTGTMDLGDPGCLMFARWVNWSRIMKNGQRKEAEMIFLWSMPWCLGSTVESSVPFCWSLRNNSIGSWGESRSVASGKRAKINRTEKANPLALRRDLRTLSKHRGMLCDQKEWKRLEKCIA